MEVSVRDLLPLQATAGMFQADPAMGDDPATPNGDWEYWLAAGRYNVDPPMGAWRAMPGRLSSGC